ncbi:hypothetical protein [Gordonibacter massiliensis (ex Traore et al. 2017)]|uniref:hypothetical protein n=1 Tax=Gordonibacter massiliensis (ex Traore et al. 2017) TaxID=1841863 RepID=UPI001C8C0DD8|nr:hypothetical protein [Gordonibacter massiliensis (ex Traore et al. 2017)]MBX9034646.1 hypothetical protein [Gordonibacter massiliensis (ex Traore et al. 2017)]
MFGDGPASESFDPLIAFQMGEYTWLSPGALSAAAMAAVLFVAVALLDGWLARKHPEGSFVIGCSLGIASVANIVVMLSAWMLPAGLFVVLSACFAWPILAASIAVSVAGAIWAAARMGAGVESVNGLAGKLLLGSVAAEFFVLLALCLIGYLNWTVVVPLLS